MTKANQPSLVQLSPRDQLTLPAAVRRTLGLRSGDAFRVSSKEGSVVLEPVAITPVELYTDERLDEFRGNAEMAPEESAQARSRWDLQGSFWTPAFCLAQRGPSFELVWDLAKAGKIVLLTSEYCRVEAERNLARRVSARTPQFAERLGYVTVVFTVRVENREAAMLPEKDGPIYAAAVAARAEVLLTGDRKHFGELMARTDLPLQVQTVRDFLLELPL